VSRAAELDLPEGAQHRPQTIVELFYRRFQKPAKTGANRNLPNHRNACILRAIRPPGCFRKPQVSSSNLEVGSTQNSVCDAVFVFWGPSRTESRIKLPEELVDTKRRPPPRSRPGNIARGMLGLMSPELQRCCIYCLEDKPLSDFNREHVIPEAFGKFEDNLVLTCVCQACNTIFSQSFELKLARDSMEGFERFSSGQKPTTEFKTYGRRSTTSITSNGEGPFKDAILYRVPDPGGNGLATTFAPQIGFAACADGPFRWFPLDKLPRKEALATKVDFPLGTQIFNRTWGVAIETAQAALEAAGYARGTVVSSQQPPSHVSTTTVYKISDPEFRTYAKIALNYLAAVASPNIALMPDFNEVRRYVRYGVLPEMSVVAMENLRTVEIQGRRVLSHYISIKHVGSSVVAHVSLFGLSGYAVLLSSTPRIIAVDFSSAHVFDLERRIVAPLPLRR